MSPTETAHLVERIVQTWPTGPRGRIWTETLEHLDPGRAGTTYVRLRNECEQPPTPARFMAVYRSLDTTRYAGTSHDYSNAIGIDEAIERLHRTDPEAAANLERMRGALDGAA